MYVRERLAKALLTAEEVGARAILLKCQERSRKHLSPQWRPCEARASLCMCGKDLLKPFSPPMRCCEAAANLFMWGKDLIRPF